MSSQSHIINKVLLEFDTGRLADVSSLQEEVSHLLQQQAVPEMERLFDRLVGNDEVVRLDRVLVEIEPVDSRFLEDEFVDKLLDALNQTLSDRLSGRMPLNTDSETFTQDRAGADWEVLLYFLEYGRLPWWCPAEDWSNWLPRWQAVMQSESQWQSPLRKLLKGNQAAQQRLVMQMPEAFRHQLVLQLQPAWTNWSTLLKQARRLMQSLKLSASLVRDLEDRAWKLLLEEIGTDNNLGRPLPVAIWIRHWLAQLLVRLPEVFDPAGTIGKGTGSLTTEEEGEILTGELFSSVPTGDTERSRSVEETKQQQDRQSNRRETPQQILRQHLRDLFEAAPMAERSLWLTVLDQVLPPTSAEVTATSTLPTENNSSLPGSDPDAMPRSTELAPVPREEESDRHPQPTGESDPDVNPNLPLVEQSSQNSLDILSMMNLPPRREASSVLSSAEKEAGLYVTQAGLVLLHPFLPIYFDAVGLLEGDLFRDESAQQTAIYLLYYLATKETDAPEYELVLPKLLCGCPLNEPVARNLDLPEAALAEGEELLQNAIAHWQALKSTSPDGLRDAFLQRDGKLTRTDSSWKLRVEEKAIDILLSRLPWGISIVRWPWMDELLTVEWT